MLDEPIEVCDYCGKILEIDHIGPDGSRYMSCPVCDADPEPLDDEVKTALADITERQTDLGIEMRDCAFLWSMEIRADDDLLKIFRIQRRLSETGTFAPAHIRRDGSLLWTNGPLDSIGE